MTRAIVQTSPVRVELRGFTSQEVKPHLDYIDKSVDYEIGKVKNNPWLIRQRGAAYVRERLEALKVQRNKTLLFEDDRGLWTYSGLGWYLAGKFNVPLINEVEYPEPELLPWAVIPDKKPYPYQREMIDLLKEARHAAVEAATGTGKSVTMMYLVKELGLRTLIMTPSVAIADQLFEEFQEAFGKKYVGRFFGGKKESKKKIVIAVDDSLVKVEEGSDHWKEFQKVQVFCSDESHTTPSNTLAKVCVSLVGHVPYRFFFSATQLRNDGKDLVLDAITGKIVYRLTVREAVDQGYLAKPIFKMFRVKTPYQTGGRDPNDETRENFYYNPIVNQRAGEMANYMVAQGRQVLILVKEVEQMTYLMPHLKYRVEFAHGGLNAGNKHKVPKQFWECDVKALVTEFNEGKLPILVGTSCLTTGVDTRPVGALIYLQGGKSEIAVRQGVGRGTRKPKGKEDCYVIDFVVENSELLTKHAMARKTIYDDIYPATEIIAL